MAARDTIVVGASAGGVEALRTLLGDLPGDLPACVLVVLHTPATGRHALATILQRSSTLDVVDAEPDQELAHGTVVVARPDHHLVVTDGRVLLSRGPRENGHRPSVDVLFRSAARALGARVIGVVLTGALDDGAAGLVAIRSRGGLGVVQDPEDALADSMPLNAIHAASPEHVVPVAEMASLLVDLVGQEVETTAPDPSALFDQEFELAQLRAASLENPDRPGPPAGLSCPDCRGPLFAIEDSGYIRYRCRVGHAWSPESLLDAGDAELEGALWMALRSLEERSALGSSMARRAQTNGHQITAARFDERAAEARRAADILRRMLAAGTGLGGAGPELGPAEITGAGGNVA